jgi:hypothetical protein
MLDTQRSYLGRERGRTGLNGRTGQRFVPFKNNDMSSAMVFLVMFRIRTAEGSSKESDIIA